MTDVEFIENLISEAEEADYEGQDNHGFDLPDRAVVLALLAIARQLERLANAHEREVTLSPETTQ